MAEKKTLFDNAIAKIKNNPLLAVVIVFGTIIITLSTFTNAVQNLLRLLPDKPKPPSIDISGHWVADETDNTPYTNFNFKVVGNQLFGTVKLPASMNMPQGISGIIDGKVIGDHVSFTTKHEYIKQFGTYNFETKERSPNIEGKFVTHYQGSIAGDTIQFMIQTDSGLFSESIAKKIIDKTIVPLKEADKYIHLFSLPGHKGGVYSLSFGPEDGRFSNGGLRLASGGAEDCLVKWWNLATAESYGEDEMCRYLPKGKARVMVAYRPKKREAGAVDLQSVSIAERGDKVLFWNWVFFSNSTAGGGGPKEIPGFVGLAAISADLTSITTTETSESGKPTISIRYSGGNIKNTFDCENQVLAVALNKDASLVAAAEKTESEGSRLRLWNAEDQSLKWIVESQYSNSVLAFSPNDSILVSGCLANGIIEIRELASGALRLTLPPNQNEGVSSLVFSDDGKLLAAGGLSSNIIRILDVKNSFALKQTLKNEGTVGALAFSRNARLIAAGGTIKGEIKVWGKAQ